MEEVLSDPAINKSGDPNKSSLNRAFNHSMMAFEWFELPENAHRLQRFSIAMTSLNAITPPEAIFQGTSLFKALSRSTCADSQQALTGKRCVKGPLSLMSEAASVLKH